MKRITLHRAAQDNAGGFQDAGTDLTVGDEAEAGVISADRAKDLVDTGGAVAVTATKREPVDHGGSAKTEG